MVECLHARIELLLEPVSSLPYLDKSPHSSIVVLPPSALAQSTHQNALTRVSDSAARCDRLLMHRLRSRTSVKGPPQCRPACMLQRPLPPCLLAPSLSLCPRVVHPDTTLCLAVIGATARECVLLGMALQSVLQSHLTKSPFSLPYVSSILCSMFMPGYQHSVFCRLSLDQQQVMMIHLACTADAR